MKIEMKLPIQQRSWRCPRCDSHHPTLHPAMQHEGEVQVCPDPWHTMKKGLPVVNEAGGKIGAVIGIVVHGGEPYLSIEIDDSKPESKAVVDALGIRFPSVSIAYGDGGR